MVPHIKLLEGKKDSVNQQLQQYINDYYNVSVIDTHVKRSVSHGVGTIYWCVVIKFFK